MSVDDFEEEWVEDGEYDNLIGDAAGEIAEVAQQCISQPRGLHKALHNTFNSIKLFEFSAFIKTANIEEQSAAMSGVGGVISQTLVRINLRYTEYFPRRLISGALGPAGDGTECRSKGEELCTTADFRSGIPIESRSDQKRHRICFFPRYFV
jgi:hypothetical protein